LIALTRADAWQATEPEFFQGQKIRVELYQVETHTIHYLLKKILKDSEPEEEAVVRNFRITAKYGKTYNT
jgi:hypothetical protein